MTTPRRRGLVMGNWKMNPLTAEAALDLARAVGGIRHERLDLGVAPPSVHLDRVFTALRSSDVLVYAQDVHWKESGAFTGQVSAAMIAAVAHGSIVGHSEVRRDQGDDDARVALKAAAALRFVPVIYCIGESLDQRRRGETELVLRRQVRRGIGAVDRGLLVAEGRPLVVAYEPVWAIGTGEAATGLQASEAVGIVRDELGAIGLDASAVRILYGGSVSAANVSEFARADGIDGALVGGASLAPEEFAAIAAAFE